MSGPDEERGGHHGAGSIPGLNIFFLLCLFLSHPICIYSDLR